MNDATKGAIYRRKDLFSTVVDDDLVLFDEVGGKYYTTHGVGTAIWEALEEPQSFDVLCDALMAKYKVDRATCERDVAKFLEELLGAGAIERTGTTR